MANAKINIVAIGGVVRLANDLRASGTGESKVELVLDYARELGYDGEHKAGNAPSKVAYKAALAAVKQLEGKVGSGTLEKAAKFAKVLKTKK